MLDDRRNGEGFRSSQTTHWQTDERSPVNRRGDWEGAIGRAMDSNMGGVLVLDDQGRVTGQLPGEPSAAAAMVTRTLDRLLASSSPGPGITAP